MSPGLQQASGRAAAHPLGEQLFGITAKLALGEFDHPGRHQDDVDRVENPGNRNQISRHNTNTCFTLARSILTHSIGIK